MTTVGRAVEKGESQGFMKVLVDAATKQILGAAILGTGGDEAVHSVHTPLRKSVRPKQKHQACRSDKPGELD